jgi:hemerythrin-like domain-containing protein
MKRAPELRTLSEDHHHGLVQARRLRRTTDADSAEAAAKGFLDFWQKDTAIHFRKEEEVLLPVMARYGGDLSREPLVEMLEDHARIRGLVMQLSDEAIGGNVRPETLHEIGERLQAHIRLEERLVFPLVEESLSEGALKELAARLRQPQPGDDDRQREAKPTEAFLYVVLDPSQDLFLAGVVLPDVVGGARELVVVRCQVGEGHQVGSVGEGGPDSPGYYGNPGFVRAALADRGDEDGAPRQDLSAGGDELLFAPL